MEIRPAIPEDAEAIAAIYSAGVAERLATFQAEPLEPAAFGARIAASETFLVALRDGAVIGVAWVSDYDPVHDYYSGVGEVTVYVAPPARRTGAGRALLEGVCAEAASRGRHKLLAKIFSGNDPSLALFSACGFREVGTHRRHGQLGGEWKDVVVVERLLTSD